MAAASLGLTQGQIADTARYTGQATAQQEAILRGQAADSARWTARGEAFNR